MGELGEGDGGALAFGDDGTAQSAGEEKRLGGGSLLPAEPGQLIESEIPDGVEEFVGELLVHESFDAFEEAEGIDELFSAETEADVFEDFGAAFTFPDHDSEDGVSADAPGVAVVIEVLASEACEMKQIPHLRRPIHVAGEVHAEAACAHGGERGRSSGLHPSFDQKLGKADVAGGLRSPFISRQQAKQVSSLWHHEWVFRVSRMVGQAGMRVCVLGVGGGGRGADIEAWREGDLALLGRTVHDDGNQEVSGFGGHDSHGLVDAGEGRVGESRDLQRIESDNAEILGDLDSIGLKMIEDGNGDRVAPCEKGGDRFYLADEVENLGSAFFGWTMWDQPVGLDGDSSCLQSFRESDQPLAGVHGFRRAHGHGDSAVAEFQEVLSGEPASEAVVAIDTEGLGIIVVAEELNHGKAARLEDLVGPVVGVAEDKETIDAAIHEMGGFLLGVFGGTGVEEEIEAFAEAGFGDAVEDVAVEASGAEKPLARAEKDGESVRTLAGEHSGDRAGPVS